MRLLPALLLLAGCAGSIYPARQTIEDRCVNARRIVLAMEIGGAWTTAQARQDMAEICGP